MHLLNHHRKPSILLYLTSAGMITTSGFHCTQIVILHVARTNGGRRLLPLPVGGSLYNDVVCTVRDIKGGEHDVVDDRTVG